MATIALWDKPKEEKEKKRQQRFLKRMIRAILKRHRESLVLKAEAGAEAEPEPEQDTMVLYIQTTPDSSSGNYLFISDSPFEFSRKIFPEKTCYFLSEGTGGYYECYNYEIGDILDTPNEPVLEYDYLKPSHTYDDLLMAYKKACIQFSDKTVQKLKVNCLNTTF